MKKILVLILSVVVVLAACSCGAARNGTEDPADMFVQVGTGPWFRVVYNIDTKVMYAVSNGAYTYGNVTLLVNADGTPMLWEG